MPATTEKITNQIMVNAADPRPFMEHMELARRWAVWNGLKGTERQALRIMRQIPAEQLRDMLKARGQ